MRFTEALIKSKEALFSSSTGSNLLSINFFIDSGIIVLIDLLKVRLPLTIERDKGDDEKRSIPSPFLARLTSVFEKMCIRDRSGNE